jgi:hypothetical protein
MQIGQAEDAVRQLNMEGCGPGCEARTVELNTANQEPLVRAMYPEGEFMAALATTSAGRSPTSWAWLNRQCPRGAGPLRAPQLVGTNR